MKHVHHYLNEFMHSKRIQQGLNFSRLIERWDDLLGDYLASRMVPVAYERGILTCRVSSSGLLQELAFLQNEILNKLQLFDEGRQIKELRLVASDVLRKQNTEDLNKMEQAAQQHLKNYHLKTKINLPVWQQRQIESETANIQDAQLQQKTRTMLMAMARRQQQLKIQHWKVCEHCQTYFEPEYRHCPFCLGQQHE